MTNIKRDMIYNNCADCQVLKCSDFEKMVSGVDFLESLSIYRSTYMDTEFQNDTFTTGLTSYLCVHFFSQLSLGY